MGNSNVTFDDLMSQMGVQKIDAKQGSKKGENKALRKAPPVRQSVIAVANPIAPSQPDKPAVEIQKTVVAVAKTASSPP